MLFSPFGAYSHFPSLVFPFLAFFSTPTFCTDDNILFMAVVPSSKLPAIFSRYLFGAGVERVYVMKVANSADDGDDGALAWTLPCVSVPVCAIVCVIGRRNECWWFEIYIVRILFYVIVCVWTFLLPSMMICTLAFNLRESCDHFANSFCWSE